MGTVESLTTVWLISSLNYVNSHHDQLYTTNSRRMRLHHRRSSPSRRAGSVILVAQTKNKFSA